MNTGVRPPAGRSPQPPNLSDQLEHLLRAGVAVPGTPF
jgi:hypothetical protein